jgi:hypothetical protein
MQSIRNPSELDSRSFESCFSPRDQVSSTLRSRFGHKIYSLKSTKTLINDTNSGIQLSQMGTITSIKKKKDSEKHQTTSGKKELKRKNSQPKK